jgi:hypothetical protein
MAKNKRLPKLRPTEHAALLLHRENLEGGDPHMGMVKVSTIASLLEKRLIAACYRDESNSDDLRYRGGLHRVFERAYVPTRLGLEVLEAMTHGPALGASFQA